MFVFKGTPPASSLTHPACFPTEQRGRTGAGLVKYHFQLEDSKGAGWAGTPPSALPLLGTSTLGTGEDGGWHRRVELSHSHVIIQEVDAVLKEKKKSQFQPGMVGSQAKSPGWRQKAR